MKTLVIGSVALVLGLYLGEWVPDVDQDYGFLTHRSVFTHGWLLPLLLFSLVAGKRALSLRLFAAGFCLGVAVHLSFDLFPRAWQGFALIHVPVFGWTYPVISWVWIAGSMLACVYLALRLITNVLQGIGVIAGEVAMFAYTGTNEATLLGPALVLAVGSIVGLSVVLWGSVSDHE